MQYLVTNDGLEVFTYYEDLSLKCKLMGRKETESLKKSC
jgi:hypothetical protein